MKWRSPAMVKSRAPVPVEQIADAVLLIRGHRVLLDSTLAGLYGVETRALVQALKRNAERFPEDFCFRLDADETLVLRSRTVMSNIGRGGRRSAPFAFTEQSVTMLSSVLRSPSAIAVNIEIMRTFVHLRRTLAENKKLAEQFAALELRLERRFANQDRAVAGILEAIRGLMKLPERAGRPIGFVTDEVKSRR
jgi:hypothetical protein